MWDEIFYEVATNLHADILSDLGGEATTDIDTEAVCAAILHRAPTLVVAIY
jgi:hypothetical protein